MVVPVYDQFCTDTQETGNCYLYDIYHEIITSTCKNVCELTLLVTSIAVVTVYFIRVGEIQTGLSVHCIFFTCISKLDSHHALFWGGSRSGIDVSVVDWFSNVYVPWIPFAKLMINDHSSVEFVVNQSLH